MMAFRDLLPSAFGAALMLSSIGPVHAQSEPAVENLDDLPKTIDPADLPTQMGTTLVEVSLGDWTLKNELASELGVRVSQVPLTISVSQEIASETCPISTDDLEQQRVISPTRTCAAKTLSDALKEEVREQIQVQESDP